MLVELYESRANMGVASFVRCEASRSESRSKFFVSSDLRVHSIPARYTVRSLWRETLLDFWYWEAFSFRSWTKGCKEEEGGKKGRRGKRVLWRMENARSISLVSFVARRNEKLARTFSMVFIPETMVGSPKYTRTTLIFASFNASLSDNILPYREGSQ